MQHLTAQEADDGIGTRPWARPGYCGCPFPPLNVKSERPAIGLPARADTVRRCVGASRGSAWDGQASVVAPHAHQVGGALGEKIGVGGLALALEQAAPGRLEVEQQLALG